MNFRARVHLYGEAQLPVITVRQLDDYLDRREYTHDLGYICQLHFRSFLGTWRRLEYSQSKISLQLINEDRSTTAEYLDKLEN
jgi:hypothetical protein